MATKLEKEKYAKIAKLGCILCRHLGYGESPCEIHHIRRFGGKRDLAPVIGLCPEHHRGTSYGLHGLGAKRFEAYHQISQEELLEMTEKLLND